MDVSEGIEFLRANHRAVLHTFRRDGGPQLSPVTAGVQHDGRVIISSRETAIKTKNLERDPRAMLCVITEKFFGDWRFVEGTCEVVHLPEAMDGLVEYYRNVAGEHPDWDEYKAAMEKERRVLLRITVSKAGPSVSG